MVMVGSPALSPGVYPNKITICRNIIIGLRSAARAALNDPNVKARLLELSVELPSEEAKTPEALKAFVTKEIDKWVPIIKKAGVTAQ